MDVYQIADITFKICIFIFMLAQFLINREQNKMNRFFADEINILSSVVSGFLVKKKRGRPTKKGKKG